MKRLVVFALISACGKYSAGGMIVGGGVGAGMGAGIAKDGEGALIGLAIGAATGLIIGGILDWNHPDAGNGVMAKSPSSGDSHFVTTGILDPDAR